MIAAVSGFDGSVMAIQRTYLRPDGMGKALFSDCKLSLGRMRDGACRLAPAQETLGLAEGVETALSAMQLYGIPVWAACGSRMEAVAVPITVTELVIFADNGKPGVLAALRAYSAHARPTRRLATVYPPSPHGDWNDLLMYMRKAAA